MKKLLIILAAAAAFNAHSETNVEHCTKVSDLALEIMSDRVAMVPASEVFIKLAGTDLELIGNSLTMAAFDMTVPPTKEMKQHMSLEFSSQTMVACMQNPQNFQ